MPGTSTRLSLFGLLVLGPVVSAGAADVTFSNQTVAAGVNVTHSTSGFAQVQYSGGATVGDFNGDGWQDLFVLSGGNNNQPDRLFINNGDGTFTNQAAAWNLTAVHKGKAACVGDFNGDGNLDLYVLSAGPAGGAAAVGHHKLYRNNGNNTFTNVAAVANVATVNPNYPDGWTCCFGDYDRDGDLDLFVGGFSTNAPSNIGSRLFRNDGGLFTDVTNASQLFIGVGPIALQSASFSDMTGDGYPELLLVGDFKGANFVGSRYMHNNGDGTFSDMTNVADCGDEENGMGQCRGDFDNDGRLDWYATSIFLPQIGWTGNKLYRNVADDQFDEYGVSAGVVDGGYGWGASAVDFNHDTWLDIAETNGDSASGGTFYQEQSYLYMNDGDNTFTERAVTSGLIHNGKGRSLVHLDYDNDGDQDVVISANNEPLNLYRNDLPFSQTTHWLRIFLDTSGDDTLAPNGYGARVLVTIGDTTMLRVIDGGASFLGMSELSAHFGLGAASIADELRIEWPNGTQTVLNDVPADRTITIAAGADCPADLDGDRVVGPADLSVLLGAWGGRGDADLDGDGTVGPADLSILLGGWGPCG